jgi:UTP:GlnB (protein PII) uridylyltransferase
MATTAEVRDLLSTTSLPADLIDDLLANASAAWMLGESAATLAADLALCHPPLGPEEVRAVVQPTTTAGTWRLCVVAHDRPGLLAGISGAVALHGLNISSVSASLWAERGMALMAVTANHPDSAELERSEWDGIGDELRAALGPRRGEPAARAVPFRAAPPVKIECTQQGQGRVLVTVEAPDRVGLLWAVASWFEHRGANIEAVSTVSTDDGMVRDSYLVVGEIDSTALAAHIGGGPAGPVNVPAAMIRLGVRVGIATAGVAAAITLRILRTGRTQSRS